MEFQLSCDYSHYEGAEKRTPENTSMTNKMHDYIEYLALKYIYLSSNRFENPRR